MLLIDSGNSAIKCRRIEQGSFTDQYFSIFKNSDLKPFEQYLQTVSEDQIYLASVSSINITHKIIESIRKIDIPLTVLETLPELAEIKNGYQNHKQLGVDRWLTILGASTVTSQDTFIIDAGTAITIDLLSSSKGHLGGAILPGFNTEKVRFQEIFPAIDFNDPKAHQTVLPGCSTLDCINSSLPVTVDTLNDIIVNWQSLLKKPLKILLCGKDAEFIERYLQYDSQVVSGLVFTGMLKQIQIQG